MNSLSNIESRSDFSNQYTYTQFEAWTVVDKRYADTVVWSSDNENVKVEALDNKSDTETYKGSVVKYAKVTLTETKPESEKVNISVKANNIAREQELIVKKSAEKLKNIKVVSSSTEQDLETYPHMSGDTIYVDMNETIKLSATVEGTIVSDGNTIDDKLVLGAEKNSNFNITSSVPIINPDNSYTIEYTIKGLLATKNPTTITIQTESGKVSKSYKVVVLAPASEIGLCREEDYNEFNLDGINLDGKGITIKEGDTPDLKEIFRPQFSTDEAYWTSSDTDVVRVSQKGELVALKEGNATITCKAKATLTSGRNDYIATCKVYVSKINEASKVGITDINDNVLTHDTLFTSTASKEYKPKQSTDEPGVPANENITWASSDEDVFTVDSNGIVTPKSAGKAILSATAEKSKRKASIEIEVIAAVQTIELSKLTTGIEGHTYELVASVDSEANQDEELTWTVSNDNIALIDPNDVTMTELETFKGKRCLVKIKSGSGTCEITVKGKYLDSAIANTKVTCTPAYTASSMKIYQESDEEEVDLKGKSLDVIKGDKVVLSSLLLTSDGKTSNDEYRWEIENNETTDGNKILDVVTDITSNNVEKLEFTPLTKGNVTIKLRDIQTNKVVEVDINAKVPATSIDIAEDKLIMLSEGQKQLSISLLPLDTSDIIEFTSSNEDIAKVDENGCITGIKSSAEEVTITAKINDELVDTCKVIVVKPILDGLVVIDTETNEELTTESTEYNKIYLEGTKTIEIKKLIKEEGSTTETEEEGSTTESLLGDEPIVWETSNESIASLKSLDEKGYTCTINGNKTGIATITAKSSISNKTVKFNVKVTQRLQSIDLPDKLSADYKGTTNQSIYLRSEYYDNIEWSVKDPEIVALENTRNGTTEKITLTGLKAGTTEVTATSADGLMSDTMIVTVNPINLYYHSNIKVSEEEFVYDGTEKKASVTVTEKDNSTVELVEDVDYTLSYSSNINAGTAVVTITGINNYKGESKKYFSIEKREIDNVKVVISQSNIYNFESSVVPKSIVVTDLGKTLQIDKDFKVTYTNNRYAGKATAEIRSSSSNYTGKKIVEFDIQPMSISKAKIEKIETQTYTGKAIKPEIKVTINTGNYTSTLTKGKDYKVVYSNNKKIGKTAQVKIIGIGNYSGEKAKTFTIKPKATNLKSVKIKTSLTGAKSLVIKWKRDKQATGYEMQYATDSTFKSGKKTIKITKGKTTSKTIKNIKSNNYYYVRMRTYKKVKGKKIYSDWSSYKYISTYTW